MRNFILFVVVLVVSYFTAPYFGNLYDKFDPQSGSWIVGKSDAIFFAGLLISYVFLIPFVFKLFGSGNKNKLIAWLLAPVILFYLYDSVKLSYIPILTAIIAFLLAKIINFTISKIKRVNPPMVV